MVDRISGGRNAKRQADVVPPKFDSKPLRPVRQTIATNPPVRVPCNTIATGIRLYGPGPGGTYHIANQRPSHLRREFLLQSTQSQARSLEFARFVEQAFRRPETPSGLLEVLAERVKRMEGWAAESSADRNLAKS
jgi:hypothetical protein